MLLSCVASTIDISHQGYRKHSMKSISSPFLNWVRVTLKSLLYAFKIIKDGTYIPHLMTIMCNSKYECQRKVFYFLIENNVLAFKRCAETNIPR